MKNEKKTAKIRRNKFSLRAAVSNDRVLLIFSFALAIVVWLVIVMVVRPDTDITISVPVSINLEETAPGKLGLEVVEVKDQTVNVTVKGKRYLLGRLSSQDISLLVFLGSVTSPGKYDLQVIPTSAAPTSDYTIADWSPKEINVKFDKMEEKEFPLDTDISLAKVAQGYHSGNGIVEHENITVKGPSAAVAKVASVVAVVEEENHQPFTTPATVDGIIQLLDKKGNPINPDVREKLALLVGGVDITDDPSVEITVPVLKLLELPITLEFINQPLYFQKNPLRYTADPEKITIAVPTDTAEMPTEIPVNIFDFTKLDPTKSKYDFDVVLPPSYTSMDIAGSVKIKLNFAEKYTERTFDVTRFEMVNGLPGFTAKVESDKLVGVVLMGPEAEMEQIKPEAIYAEVDMAFSNKTGKYVLPAVIRVKGHDKCWGFGEFSVAVNLQEKS